MANDDVVIDDEFVVITKDASDADSLTHEPDEQKSIRFAVPSRSARYTVTLLLDDGTKRMAGEKSLEILPCALIHVLAVIVTEVVDALHERSHVPGP